MANANRSAQRDRAAALAHRGGLRWGDSITYTTGAGSAVTVSALVPKKFLNNAFQDEERIVVIIPYQTNFTSNPDTGATITVNSIKYLIESSEPDDGEWPVAWTIEGMRWLHDSP